MCVCTRVRVCVYDKRRMVKVTLYLIQELKTHYSDGCIILEGQDFW